MILETSVRGGLKIRQKQIQRQRHWGSICQDGRAADDIDTSVDWKENKAWRWWGNSWKTSSGSTRGGGDVDKGRGSYGPGVMLVGSGWICYHTTITRQGYIVLRNIHPVTVRWPGLLLIHLSVPGGHLYNCYKSNPHSLLNSRICCICAVPYHVPSSSCSEISDSSHYTVYTEQGGGAVD